MSLRIVQPHEPPHPLLRGLPDDKTLERLLAAVIDETVDPAARAMGAETLRQLLRLARARLEAVAAGDECRLSILRAHGVIDG